MHCKCHWMHIFTNNACYQLIVESQKFTLLSKNHFLLISIYGHIVGMPTCKWYQRICWVGRPIRFTLLYAISLYCTTFVHTIIWKLSLILTNDDSIWQDALMQDQITILQRFESEWWKVSVQWSMMHPSMYLSFLQHQKSGTSIRTKKLFWSVHERFFSIQKCVKLLCHNANIANHWFQGRVMVCMWWNLSKRVTGFRSMEVRYLTFLKQRGEKFSRRVRT